MAQLNKYQRYYDSRVTIIGRAASDGVYGDRSQLVFDLDNIQVVDPETEYLKGKIAVSGFDERSILRGDVVQVEGKLTVSRGSRQGRMSFAQLKVLGRDGSIIEESRRGFVAGMQSALPEPSASFGLGLIIGQRSTLPDGVLASLSAVGLTHIVAVSGYNLTILERAIRRMLEKRSKFQTLVGSLALMMAFLLITGLSASIVRAVIVSSLGLLAWYWGRQFKPVLLILVAAALTAGWNPFYIWSDLGWYLSFLAFYGVLVLAPLLTKRFTKKPKPNNLSQVIVESLCAWAMTAPLILFIFKEVSVIALLANTLVVPLVPLAMGLSAVAGVAGALFSAVSGWAAWPANIILTYILDIANLLSNLPRAVVRKTLSAWQLTALYFYIFVFTLVLWQATKRKHVPPITE